MELNYGQIWRESQNHPNSGPISGQCVWCRKGYTTALVNVEAISEWNNGKLAQVAFPSVSPEDREFLISGVCPNCWSFSLPEEE